MPEVVRVRRRIHSHPELGFEEFETGKICAETLQKAGVATITGVGRTGVVGSLQGRCAGRTVALRADMDALPITEETGLEFTSCVPGLMHACGHDGHVAVLLGAAMVLARLRHKFPGSVKFIFQPAEESLGGAREMIGAGVLENPRVDAIFALHLWPDIPLGHIAIHKGRAMAALDKVSITLKGRGGHVATPHKSVDAIVAASLLVLALQTVVSREIDPVEPAVLSIGDFKAGTAYNAIADHARLRGTVRTLDASLRQSMPESIERKLRGIAESVGTDYDFEYTFGYPPVANDSQMAELVFEVCTAVVGRDRVSFLERPSMVGEDFAYYLERTPGAIFLLGTGTGFHEGDCGEASGKACQACPTGNESRKESAYPLHHSRFQFDE
ncbi:MAG: amidohydrolase, partial [Bacillota bacterium]